MAYSKQTWADSPATTSPLSAARLNHIEDGIQAAASVGDTAAANIAGMTPATIGAAVAANTYTKTETDAGFLSKTTGGTVAGAINANGGIFGQYAQRLVSADSTLTPSDQILYLKLDTQALSITVPAASGGKYIWTLIALAGTFNASLVTNAGDAVVGSALIYPGARVTVITDGTNTVYIVGNSIPEHSIVDQAFFLNESMGAAKTVLYSPDRKRQTGVLTASSCTITLAGIPDGGQLELQFATNVSNAQIVWAQSISGVTSIVWMTNNGAVSQPPTASGKFVSYLVSRIADTLYIRLTGANA